MTLLPYLGACSVRGNGYYVTPKLIQALCHRDTNFIQSLNHLPIMHHSPQSFYPSILFSSSLQDVEGSPHAKAEPHFFGFLNSQSHLLDYTHYGSFFKPVYPLRDNIVMKHRYKTIFNRLPTAMAPIIITPADLSMSLTPNSLASTTKLAMGMSYVVGITLPMTICLALRVNVPSNPMAISLRRKPTTRADIASGGSPSSLLTTGAVKSAMSSNMPMK